MHVGWCGSVHLPVWQRDCHGCSSIGRAVESNRPAMIVENALTECQADTGGTGFCREEQLEQSWEQLGGNRWSVVVDATAPSAARRATRSQGEIAAFRRG